MLGDGAELNQVAVGVHHGHGVAPQAMHRLEPLDLQRQLLLDVARVEDGLQVQPLALDRQPGVEHVAHLFVGSGLGLGLGLAPRAEVRAKSRVRAKVRATIRVRAKVRVRVRVRARARDRARDGVGVRVRVPNTDPDSKP